MHILKCQFIGPGCFPDGLCSYTPQSIQKNEFYAAFISIQYYDLLLIFDYQQVDSNNFLLIFIFLNYNDILYHFKDVPNSIFPIQCFPASRLLIFISIMIVKLPVFKGSVELVRGQEAIEKFNAALLSFF